MAGTRWLMRLPDPDGPFRDLLEDLGIPYPRTVLVGPSAVRATAAWTRIADGFPVLRWEWSFARTEWLEALFGRDWIEGRAAWVDRTVRGLQIPIERGAIIVPERAWRVRFRRPALHRDARWDMGVWREVEVEGILLYEISS